MTKIFAATLIVGLMASVSMAQQPKVVADIPFDFYVGDTKLPAGAYEIKPAGTNAVRVASVSGTMSVATLTSSAKRRGSANDSKLVFHVYGSDYFLSQIWQADTTIGSELPTSRSERQMARGATPARVEAATR
jgi:hypothetical protein